MATMTKRRVLYGEANYKNLIKGHGYYVDKTEYIRLMESYRSPVFLRPRRFGKSLMCTTLSYYYDINESENFKELFGNTSIGKNPTPGHNSYMVLSLDFSIIDPSGSIEDIRRRFNNICNIDLQSVIRRYKKYLGEPIEIDLDKDVSINLKYILAMIKDYDLPRLYILIDEYDNFSNRLITSNQDTLYRELTKDDSFLKTFFKALKNGIKEDTIVRTFITGVLPITIDDLASGYNIARFLTLEREFEAMLGFTQKEVDNLLDIIYSEHDIDPETRKEVTETIANNYNGYHFVDPEGEPLFNSTILIYFLDTFIRYKEIPRYLIDVNLKTDISWVKRLTASNPANTEELVDRLLIENKIIYNEVSLLEKFNMSQFFDKNFYPISFFYLGMLTRRDDQYMCLPNLSMRSIFVDYFNQIHSVDISTKYAEMMRGFIDNPDIPRLFGDYWRLYISQLPEAIFQKVNENFYRTTFFELCRNHLSGYFTWGIENSYAGGRTDLEFTGRFHTKFAGLRFLLEFKYYSNAKWNKIKTGKKRGEFEPPEDDLNRIREYKEEWKRKHPNGQKGCFLIYCFGNQGYRVFPVEV